MASERTFVEFVVDQMGSGGSISYKKMFGEYAIYCDGKVVAPVCNNQLFVKQTDKGRSFIGSVVEAPPYPGAKLSFLIEDKIDDREWIGDLIRITAKEVPSPQQKQIKTKAKTKAKTKKRAGK